MPLLLPFGWVHYQLHCVLYCVSCNVQKNVQQNDNLSICQMLLSIVICPCVPT